MLTFKVSPSKAIETKEKEQKAVKEKREVRVREHKERISALITTRKMELLRNYVYTKQEAGESFALSDVYEEALQDYIDKHGITEDNVKVREGQLKRGRKRINDNVEDNVEDNKVEENIILRPSSFTKPSFSMAR